MPNDVVELIVMKKYSLIKAWRTFKKLSQKDIAEKMGISQSTYSQMEQPEANLRKETLQKIADAMEVGVE